MATIFSTRFNRMMAVSIVLIGIGVLIAWPMFNKTLVNPVGGHFQLFSKSLGNPAVVVSPNDPLLLQTDVEIEAEELSKSIHITPSVPFHLVEESGVGVFRIAAEEPLTNNTVYTISIDQGALTREPVSFAIQTKAPFGVVTSVPRDTATMVPVDSGIEVTFNRTALGSIDGRWGITPSIKATVDVVAGVVTVVPQENFKYGTVYTFTIAKDFGPIEQSDEFDALKDDIHLSFETQPNPARATSSDTDRPYYYIYPDRILTEFDRQSPTFSVSLNKEASNREWGFALYRFDAEDFEKEWNASMRFENRWSAYNLFRSGYQPPERNRVSQFKTKFTFDEGRLYSARMVVPGSLPTGVYLLATTDSPSEPQYVWFQVTPLHTSITAGEHQSVVWVKRLSDVSSVKGATVRVSGQDLGSTNEQGVLVFPTPDPMIIVSDHNNRSQGSSDLVRVIEGSDIVYAPVDDVRVARNERIFNFISTDRKLYLPTDELAFWGVANSPTNDIRVQDLTVSLTNQSFWGLDDWYGQYLGGGSDDTSPVYASARVTVSPSNTYDGTLSFDSIRPGYYALQVKRGNEVLTQKGIQIATFTKPSYRITTRPAKQHLFAEESNSIEVKAQFFSGEPVGGIELQYEGSIPQTVSGRLRLDDTGTGRITVTPRYNPSQQYYPTFAQVTFTPVRAEEAEITASANFSVYGPAIALHVSQEGKERTTTYHIKATVVDLLKDPQTEFVGSAVGALSVTAKVLYEYDEQFVREQRLDPITKKTYPVYDYKHISKEVDKKILTTGPDGVVDYQWTASERRGMYTIIFEATDRFGRRAIEKEYLSTWMFWDSSESSAQTTAPTYIRFSANNPHPDESNGSLYRLNDPITLTAVDERDQVVAGGAGQFLVYQMYGNGIQEAEVIDGPQWKSSFITKYSPTLVVGGVYWGLNGFQSISAVSLYLNPNEKKLGVNLMFDKQQYRPSDTARATITVTDPNTSPAPANVQLTLIDEVIYSLYGYDDDVLNETYAGFVYAYTTRNSHPYELRYALNENTLGAERGGCFAYGSRVLAPDGKTILIQDLKAGDVVLTPVSDTNPQLVEAVIAKNQPWSVDRLLVINNRLRVTFNHIVMVNGQWNPIGKARIGDWLKRPDGSNEIITSIQQIDGRFDVFNPVLEDLHTYVVDGVYVHNAEKGGGLPNGMVRKNFKNTAFVGVKNTDASGVAEFSIKLPDNLTAWRARAQAATGSMFLGSIIERITTNLPFFVEPLINPTYLSGDQPIVRIRSNNASGKRATSVRYQMKSESLRLDKTLDAGEEIELPLGALPVGEHRITIEGVAGGVRDAVERIIVVNDSYKTILKSQFQAVQNGTTTIRENSTGLTQLVFADQSTAGLVSMLESLCYRNGNRAEWKVVSGLSHEALNALISTGCPHVPSPIDVSQYQRESGAFSILPYSSDDLDLTVSMVAILPESSYDSALAKRYLLDTIVHGGADRKRQVTALYGLSVFRASILPALTMLSDRADLDTDDRITLALAFKRLGALPQAREQYDRWITNAINRQETVASVDGATPDETAVRTARAAILAVALGYSDHRALWEYVRTHQPENIVVDAETIAYAQSYVNTNGGGQSVDAAVDVVIGDRTIPMKFGQWNSQQTLNVTSDELKAIEFKNLQGLVGLFSYYEVPSITYDGPKNSQLSVSRRYLVNGVPATVARVGDSIDVELSYRIDPRSEDDGYTITDYLPGGLKAVSSPVAYNSYDPDRTSVGLTDIEGQAVRLRVWKGNGKSDRLVYRVRAIQKGVFKADGANIRSDLHPSQYNYSNDDRITIQ